MERKKTQGAVGLSTYFNNRTQDDFLGNGGRKLISPPTPEHKTEKYARETKAKERKLVEKAKARRPVGITTALNKKQFIGDLPQGRKYLENPEPTPPRPHVSRHEKKEKPKPHLSYKGGVCAFFYNIFSAT